MSHSYYISIIDATILWYKTNCSNIFTPNSIDCILNHLEARRQELLTKMEKVA